MPRPDLSLATIDLPGIDTPMGDFAEQACGVGYNVAYKVRKPYKGIDNFEVHLPVRSTTLGAKPVSEMSQADLDALTEPLEKIVETINAAQRLVDGKAPALPVRIVSVATGGYKPATATILEVVDPKNHSAIQHLIDQSLAYGAAAVDLWNYWAEQWEPKQFKVHSPANTSFLPPGLLPHWPLNRSLELSMPKCSGLAPGTVVNMTSGYSPWGGAWSVDVQCPDAALRNLHQSDINLFQQLLRAAMIWARCAEEAAAVIGVWYLNRAQWLAKYGDIGEIAKPPAISDPVSPPPQIGPGNIQATKPDPKPPVMPPSQIGPGSIQARQPGTSPTGPRDILPPVTKPGGGLEWPEPPPPPPPVGGEVPSTTTTAKSGLSGVGQALALIAILWLTYKVVEDMG